jgi:uncharacterized protein YbjT (DUF2867 family)
MARKTDGAPADALRAKGVELVAGNMKSSEDLKKAFAGASNLFAVTQAWDKETAGSEFDIGKLIADEAKSAFVFCFNSHNHIILKSKRGCELAAESPMFGGLSSPTPRRSPMASSRFITLPTRLKLVITCAQAG